MSNPFQNALEQLARAVKLQNFKEDTVLRLQNPEREVKVFIPVKMDNGAMRIFEGYRVEHSNARGPYKGGIRYHEEADLDEVRALAFWMTLKTAVAGIPMGGGKGGITVNPKELSEGELERLSRGFVKMMWPLLGPDKDVPAPDVNTTPRIMEWMNDEYMRITGEKTGATFTGKPLEKGGSEGRGAATGMGGFYVFEALREKLNIQNGASVVIQGMGNVGANAARIFENEEYRIIAISDSRGGIFNENGLSFAEVERYKKEKGILTGFPGSKAITNDELLLLPCDVLIPAALENQITLKNASNIRAKIVLELANGPTTPEADDILFEKRISVIPDILANSGGVVVSTFEWEQNRKGEHWSEEQVFEKLKKILFAESENVWNKAQELKTDLRRGAFILALKRLEDAM